MGIFQIEITTRSTGPFVRKTTTISIFVNSTQKKTALPKIFGRINVPTNSILNDAAIRGSVSNQPSG
jgi:hypothetical protein